MFPVWMENSKRLEFLNLTQLRAESERRTIGRSNLISLHKAVIDQRLENLFDGLRH